MNSTLFNEDMIYAATAMDAGYAVAYVPEAKVVHSHNLTPTQQFHRNFDLAVSQAEHPEIFAELKSEGEGIRLVKQTAKYLLVHFRGFLIPELVVSSGCKYLGYKLGKQYESAIFWIVRALVLVVYSVFPKVADACASLLGIYATTNFLFLFAIFVLILKVFFMSIHISQLESKIKELVQAMALEEKKYEEEKH